ncbi:MAG: metallopeptidase family protein [Deltaproteobacteria bacterium]|nr:metallopeptidase family protein [Deltaproteobacteria bacterium]
MTALDTRGNPRGNCYTPPVTQGADRILDDAWLALDRGQAGRARMLARRALKDGRYGPEALHVIGRAFLDEGDGREAAAHLEKALAGGGDSPDLHYDLGLAFELLGREKDKMRAFLEVLARDPGYDRDLPAWLDEDRLVAVAEAALEELPEGMLSRLGPVPILVEDRPERQLVEQGFDPRALGLFDGPPWSCQGLTGPALNRIVLYRVNIGAASRSEEEAAEEVRITLLHELAHFFGIEEDGMEALGLA